MFSYFITKCRPFIFNTGLPPAIAGATLSSLGLLTREPGRLVALWANGKACRRERETRGRKVVSDTAIVPILVGADGDTMAVSRALFDRGMFVHGIRPPTVPEGTGRLRLTLMATHTAEMVRTAAVLIDAALRERGIGTDGAAGGAG